MSLSPKEITDIATQKASYLALNSEIIDIYENNLTGYIEDELANQLSGQSYEQAKHRISPINILPKVIDKLTNIYQTSVTRRVDEGSQSDKDLLDYYKQLMRPNDSLNLANEMFNLCQATLIYPCIKKGKPALSIIENDKFIPVSTDPMEPGNPSHFIILAGPKDGKDIYWVWSDQEFYITDSDHKYRYDLMSEIGNVEGMNPIGRLPFVYVNDSKRKILPKQDIDMLKIVKLIPVMLSDLNLAAMFQSFAIIYGIDVDDENLSYAPNAFWRLKSDPTSDKTPQIGTIKPQVDYNQVLGLIEAQISMWLGTKGIKSSSIGSLTKDNFASGISKIIDEMDTFEARQKQVTIFEGVETDLWDIVLNSMHPYWLSQGLVSMRNTFSTNAQVITKFAIQLPQQSRGQVVRDVKEEYAAGFTSRKRAIEKLNPELTDEQIEELIIEIDEERENATTESEDRDTGALETQPEDGASGPDS